MHIGNRPRIGLALGGGGARGLAHIGVIKALERAGIPIDMISGTSMGGILAAAYGAGLSIEDLEAQAVEMSRLLTLARLADVATRQRSLIGGRGLRNFLVKNLRLDTTFDKLRLPVALVATDIRHGRLIVLNHGSVVDAAIATSAFPAVFPAVKIEDTWLADGAILDNVPVNVAYALGAERVIAVDVIPSIPLDEDAAIPEPLSNPYPFAGIIEEVYNSMWMLVAANTAANFRQCPPDVLIRPPIAENVRIFTGFRRATSAIAAGEQAAEEALPQIRALLECL